MLRLFYVTDIHGSNVCYRKFLNAIPIYQVDVAILNGDLLGKVLIPQVEKRGGGRECHLMGQYTTMDTPEEIAATKKDHRERRLLLGGTDPGGIRGHQGRPRRHRRLVQEACHRAHRGVAPTG